MLPGGYIGEPHVTVPSGVMLGALTGETAVSNLSVHTEQVQAPGGEPASIAHVVGTLDAGTLQVFCTSLDELLESGATDVVVDLFETSYVNSTGLATLLKYNDAVRQREGRMAYARVPAKVLLVMRMLGFTTLFTVCDDIPGALAYISGADTTSPQEGEPEAAVAVDEPADPETAPPIEAHADPVADASPDVATDAPVPPPAEAPAADIPLNAVLDGLGEATQQEIGRAARSRRATHERFFATASAFEPGSKSRALMLCVGEAGGSSLLTPGTPSASGGGYFLRYRGKGIAVDPGRGFLATFAAAGGRLIDIDYVLVTRSTDRTAGDLGPIFDALHRFERTPKGEPKRVHLYLPAGAVAALSPVIALRGTPNVASVTTLHASGRTDGRWSNMHGLPGAHLTALPAYGCDVTSPDESVGLAFRFDVQGGSRTVVFTGETTVYPPLRMSDGSAKRDGDGRPVLDVDPSKALHERYPQEALSPDLLVAYAGTIDDHELQRLEADTVGATGLDAVSTPPESQRSEARVFGTDALGLRGLHLLLTGLAPRSIVVGELGIESADARVQIARALGEATGGQFVAPGDTAIACDITSGRFLCHASRRFEDAASIDCMAVEDDASSPFFRAGSRRTCVFEKPLPADDGAAAALRAFYEAIGESGLPAVLSGED